ncbi:MAG: type IV secretion system protein [Burkholderiales bacterium]|nr:type IV secretion system protein [Burkholderiales bacterium]
MLTVSLQSSQATSFSTKFRRFCLVALLVVVGLASGIPAMSQDAPPQPFPEETPEEVADSLPQRAMQRTMELITAVEGLISQVGNGGVFNSLGRRLTAVLGATVIIWSILKNMVLKATPTQIIADLVFPMIVMAMCVAALDQNFAGKVNASVQALMSGLSPGSTNSGSVAVNFVKGMLKAIAAVWTQSPGFTIKDIGFTYLASLLLQLMAVVFIAIGTAVGLGVIFMAKFQIAFAIALAPVMIPWLMLKPTEFLFSGWLTFLLKGGFVLVAVSAIAGAISASVAGLNTIAAGSVAGIDSALTYAAIALMAMLFAFLLYKSADIGSGVISGGVSGISGMGRVIGGAGAKMLGGAGKIGGKAAGGAIGIGSAAAMGKAHAGKMDRQLSPGQKSMQPRRGSFQRKVYEFARGAPADGTPSPTGAGAS